MIAEGMLRCSTGGDDFAIRATEVRHVARADQMRIDAREDGRAGSLKLGGHEIPVFCLRKALRLPPIDAPPGGDRHIAVTGDHDELVGWLADRVTRESSASAARLVQLPPAVGGTARRWFDAVVTSADGTAMLLINPRQLNPLHAAASTDDQDTPPFAVPPAPDHRPAEPVALIFSTTVLPASGVEKFALSGRQVVAIVQPAEAIAVPGCAAHVAGLTMWRDLAVPIVDFRDAAVTDTPNRRRLIARAGQSLIALAIDADVLMHRPTPDNRLLGDVPRPAFATGVFDLNGDRVALLDLDAMLAGAA